MALVALGSVGAALVLTPAVPVIAAPVAWAVAGLGIGIAYSTLSLVVLETAPAGQEGVATAGMQLANALAVALGAGVGGVLIAAFSSADDASRASVLIQDLLMIGVAAATIVVAGRLPGKPSPPPTSEHPVAVDTPATA